MKRTLTPAPVPRVLRAALRPFQAFFRTQTSSSILLLAATGAAFAWANSRWSESYHHLLEQVIAIQVFGHALSWPLHHWVNDALMAVFFFVVGMEIKRELVLGELAEVRRAILPAIAAAGGMAVPAAIFLIWNSSGPGARGWGVPVATDIAFALGCLAVLRGRVPPSLGVFLTALAIFDDLGAILIIALFYGGTVNVEAIAVVGGLVVALVVLNRYGVRRAWPYLVLGVALWVAFLASGLHATLAGVVLGLCIPARPRRAPDDIAPLVVDLGRLIDWQPGLGHQLGAQAEQVLEAHLADTQAPLDRLLHALHPWVAFGVVPVFALANAGVELANASIAVVTQSVTVGVALGLFLGKQVGIFLATFLAVKLRICPMPSEATWRQVHGIAVLGGIGFTMSLFIGALALGEYPELATQAKVGILLGSATSAIVGLALLRGASRRQA